MIQTLNKLGLEEMYLKLIIYDKRHSKHHTQRWNVESFSLKIRNQTRVPNLALIFNIVLEILARWIRLVNEIKVIKTGKNIFFQTWFCMWQILKIPPKYYYGLPTNVVNYRIKYQHIKMGTICNTWTMNYLKNKNSVCNSIENNTIRRH